MRLSFLVARPKNVQLHFRVKLLFLILLLQFCFLLLQVFQNIFVDFVEHGNVVFVEIQAFIKCRFADPVLLKNMVIVIVTQFVVNLSFAPFI
jgi:hypothetical protein